MVSFSGIGIHTGAEVSLRFVPSASGTGIFFKRIDLPGQPVIPAKLEHVCDTSRSTTLGIGDVRIHTVEHVLAALKAYQIDNVSIEISNIEPPVGDGSSKVFVDMIEEAGIEEQDEKMPILTLSEPVYYSQGDVDLVALPSDEYRVSYTLSYPDSTVLSAQYCSVVVSPENFKKELAPCRTFAKYEEVSYLMDQGLIRGGSLDNAVIIKDDAVISHGGLRFSNEMARHKALDIIGDLSLVGFDFHAHIIAIRAGHATNYKLAQKILKMRCSHGQPATA